MHSVIALLWRLGLLLALLSGSGCAWLDTQKRQLIYRPTAASSVDMAAWRAGDQRYLVSLAGAEPVQHLSFWWLPNARSDAPTLLYLHGTFRNLQGNWHKMESLREAGFSVLAVDYRGWGESSLITPSEPSILADAQVAWRELKQHQPSAKMRVIYGHSMGSGVAVDLASGLHSPHDYGGLILESAFSSFSDLAHTSGWLASVLNLFNPDQFDTIAKITKVQAPLLMLHGSRDDTVPIELAERLFAAANTPKHWLTMPDAAHSDLDQINPLLYRATLQKFTASYLSRH
jgi:pimeloyl-ACP methyl ester carboxylesterase